MPSLEGRSPRWGSDPEAARNALTAAMSLVLRLLGREPDPAKSRQHVLLSVLAERRLLAGQSAELGASWGDAAALNRLLAAPSFASWRQGTTLDVGEWLTPSREQPGKTPIVIVSVAHLDDEERALVLGVLLEEVLSWVRTLPGSQRLRALLVFDEVRLPAAPPRCRKFRRGPGQHEQPARVQRPLRHRTTRWRP